MIYWWTRKSATEMTLFQIMIDKQSKSGTRSSVAFPCYSRRMIGDWLFLCSSNYYVATATIMSLRSVTTHLKLVYKRYAVLGFRKPKNRRFTILGNPLYRLISVVDISELHFFITIWTVHYIEFSSFMRCRRIISGLILCFENFISLNYYQ